jgi:putative DNA primase/helicase
MSEAERIAAKLDGVREGREWRCLCPSHNGHSLFLRDGSGGKLLAKCFGGCSWDEILDGLREQGLVNRRSEKDDPNHAAELRRIEEERTKAEGRLHRRIARARDLYRKGAPASGTPVETYLRVRGITLSIPKMLRFLPLCPHRADPQYDKANYPAMLAPIVNVRGEQIGCHKTFLKPDGSGKADLPKELQRETCGPFKTGAIRLAPHGSRLLVGEGIESVLSAMQMFGLPGWAAICAQGIEALELPSKVPEVLIAADRDESGTGQRAALIGRRRWQSEGRSVRILLPPNIGEDFNDVLLAGR